MNDMLSSALAYADQGFRVFPLRSGNKTPATPKGCLDATADSERITEWWSKNKTANIGLATGSGLLALDFDCKHGQPGLETLTGLVQKGLPLDTLNSSTPTGGKHYLYRLPEGMKIGNRTAALPGLDIRGDGGYIVVAPSQTKAKMDPKKLVDGCYKWTDPNAAILPAPTWLLDLLANQVTEDRGKERKERARSVEPFEREAAESDLPPCLEYRMANGFPTGSRNDALFSLGVYAKQKYPETWETILEELNQQYLTPGTAQEVHAVIKSLNKKDYYYKCNQEPLLSVCDKATCRRRRYGIGQGQENLTDLGNAERLIRLHGDKIAYLPERKRWMAWDGSRWVLDLPSGIHGLAFSTVRHMIEEANDLPDEQRRALITHSIKSEKAGALGAMVEIAAKLKGVPVPQSRLDSDPYLFNTLNGTLDLRTGLHRAADRSDLITKIAPVKYDASAECPLWLSFLNRIMAGKQSLIGFLRRALGYSLTGDTGEQCFFFLHGNGANGKSTYLNIARAMLGDYALQAPAELLMATDRRSVSNDLARLHGARFVATSETEDGQRFAESTIKQMTGQDTITARFLYGEFFEFRPPFKIWLAANHKPVLRGTDHAIWRRIHLVPFTVTIPQDEQDRHLEAKLMNELPGILNWALEGCLEWQKNGLQPPEEVQAAVKEYRQDMDQFGQWFDECCVVAPEGKAHSMKTGATELYRSYKEWSENNTGFSLSQTKFGRTLRERGFTNIQTPRSVWLGIGLRESPF